MGWTGRRLGLVLTGLLIAGAAGAETYRSLEGTFVLSGDEVAPLEGWLEVLLAETEAPPVGRPATLLVDDFSLRVGDDELVPRGPIVYEGLEPLFYLEAANQLHVEPDWVRFLHLRSGGALVAEEAEQVTFRFVELRGGTGPAVGEIGEDGLPRRLHLSGTLYEVDQTFRLPGDDCATPGGGGVSIGLGPGGDSTIIDGSLTGPGATLIAQPAPTLSAAAESGTLTLEDLGIEAPAGAELFHDGQGGLTIRTEGDLILEGGIGDFFELTSLTLIAGGDIHIEGELRLAPDASLHLEAGGNVAVPELAEGVGDGRLDIEVIPLCRDLRPVFPTTERRIGAFTLVVTAAQPIRIGVQRKRGRGTIRPDRREAIAVGVFGAEDLDVEEIVPSSLRLGPSEAMPIGRRSVRRDLDGDGHRDLLHRFWASDLEAGRGDHLLCLVASDGDGDLLEGCDTIAPRP
jgi:hypothetical protein